MLNIFSLLNEIFTIISDNILDRFLHNFIRDINDNIVKYLY